MLSYDALIEQAQERGMPAGKMRGILREYLQVLILKALYAQETGKKLFFTGGTYLRLLHNLKRFSEDLDFNTAAIEKKEFETLVGEIRRGLKRLNIDCEITFEHWRNIYCGNIVFPAIEKAYNIASPYANKRGVVIKIETNRPRWRIKTEAAAISGFGELYPCVCTDRAALFADKIDAMNKKERARHIYDVMFMLSNGYPIDKRVLSALGIHSDPLELILKRIKSFSRAELKKQAETIRPFLFEEREAELIADAHNIIPSLVERYRGIRKH